MRCLIYCRKSHAKWTRQYFSDADPYMLCIGNKPLLEFYIEFCALNEVREIYIAEKGVSAEIRDYFGNGSKWDVTINYILINEELDIGNIIRSNKDVLSQENLLIFTGYFFLQYKKAYLSKDFLPVDYCWENLNENGDGIMFLRHPLSYEKGNEMKFFEGKHFLHSKKIDGIKSYFYLNMDMAAGDAKNYIMHSYSSETGVFIGQNVEIMYGCEVTKPVIFGDNIQLKRRSEIGPGVIIGSNSLVDSDTIVRNSLIYSNSYIGTKLEVVNKIIYRRRLIDPESGAVIHIVDDFLLAEVRNDLITSIMSRGIELALICFLFCIQLPFYVLLRPWVRCRYHKTTVWRDKSGTHTVTFKRFISKSDKNANKLFIKFSLHKFHLLPMCLSRKLRLIGNAPQPATNAALRNVRELSNYRPSVFSFSDMYGEEQSDEKRQVNELFYAKHATLGLNISIFFKTLIFNFFGSVHGKGK